MISFVGVLARLVLRTSPWWLALCAFVAWPAEAQTCPTIPAQVDVRLSGSIRFPDIGSEAVNSVLTHTQDANQCIDNPPGLSGVVCSYATPFTGVLAAKMLQVVDRPAQGGSLLDVACGNLRGTLAIGEGADTLVTGSVTIQFVAPRTVNAVIDLTANIPALALSGVPGRAVLSEEVAGAGPGDARGSGTARFEILGETVELPFVTRYRLLGSPSVLLPFPRYVTTDVTYNCGTPQVTSRLCIGSLPPAVPLPRTALPLLGLGLLGVGVFVVARRRGRARLS
jgi:hypothetical protein